MKVVEFTHSSPLYRRTLELRDLFLRRPLGLHLSDEDIRNEENQRHFAMVDGDDIIGGLIARIETDRTSRFRQMWIDPNHSSSGLGKHLLTSTEASLAEEGIRCFHLHARESARGFYLKCGYHTSGETFIEIGIPHISMKKSFVPERSFDT